MTGLRCFCIILFPLLLQLASCSGCTLSPVATRGSVTVLSYNVENLFDDVDNGSEYSDFDPGRGEWNTDLYHAKLHNIAEVVRASVKGGPDILALQEIENFNALIELRDSYLGELGYKYGLIADDDGSAVNVAFLSKIPVVGHFAHRAQIGDIGLRSVLEARFDVSGIDLVVFNCHWKSKSGGAEETEELRIASAGMVAERLRELFEHEPDLEILVAGDLNERIDEYDACGRSCQTAIVPVDDDVPAGFFQRSIAVTGDAGITEISAERVVLFSPWHGSSSNGSYVYGDVWERIDHFLVSESLMDGVGIAFEAFEVVARDFMINKSGYPARWSTRSASGYSDHLPLLLHLRN